MTAELFVGLISGTSRDGVDAALVDFEDGRPALLHATCTPYPPVIREQLDALLASGRRPDRDAMHLLDRQLGHLFARACLELLEAAGFEPRDIRAIGSHGQTVWHEPGGDAPVSLQLGNGVVMANVTGIPTVTDFRTADILAGGQGAPLAPLLHRELFHDPVECRAVVNLGGIANITVIGPDGSVHGHDTGPANCLLDLWSAQHQGQPFDDAGAWAASGDINARLLERLLDEPYFAATPPKSTGLETFNRRWLETRLEGLEVRAKDVQATLAELTAATVSAGLLAHRPDRVLVCGGGAHNDHLLARLGVHLALAVESTGDYGMHPDWVEACLFAWLARQRIDGCPLDTGPVTGARQPVLLGEIHQS